MRLFEGICMSDYTVTVVGATGKSGRHVAAQAATRGWQVRAAARRKPSHGEWIRMDWDDEATWSPAFSGSDAAYVVIAFNHPGAPQKAPRLLEVATAAGVRRIVLLSTMDVENAPPEDPMRTAEVALQELPIRSALVRPTWFLDNFTTGSFSAMTADGELRLPAGEGKIPFVDTRDVAAVAVAALALDGPEGPIPVTGPEKLSHHQVAAALGAVLGRSISYTSVSAEEFIGLLAARGFPPEYGEFLAGALVDVASGRLKIPVTDTVERFAGRRPYTVTDFARYHATETGAR
jgi:uncharacterized protein YbjT (DUF2867 family)